VRREPANRAYGVTERPRCNGAASAPGNNRHNPSVFSDLERQPLGPLGWTVANFAGTQQGDDPVQITEASHRALDLK
jgi:hypothetical protein